MIAWTIAGSDSGGGAGVQADLKTFHGLGVHGCTVIVGLTAQNTKTVAMVEPASQAMIEAQFDALADDLPPRAVKSGMLGSADIMQLTARRVAELGCFYVCDPVMVATSGGVLMDPGAMRALKEDLLPVADIVTPNRDEAEALCGFPLRREEDVVRAAARILEYGAKSVLIKGGHGEGPYSQDYWTDGGESFWLTGPRVDSRNSHGSGCTLAAAIAAATALGYDLANALVIAKAFVTRALRAARRLGGGFGPVRQGGWPDRAEDMPWLTASAAAGRERPHFPDCGPEPMGFYPIVDRSAWLERLLPLGVRTVQLRIKDLAGEDLEREIAAAVALSRAHDARLFVNDYWPLAVKLGAYGVHLGQEDLADADAPAIARAGLRLGVSTHDYAELARALSLRPSYVALGPVYETTSKAMRFAPQGVDRVSLWRALAGRPLVAIGGLTRERAPAVIRAGADSVAVISAVSQAERPEAETQQWLRLFSEPDSR